MRAILLLVLCLLSTTAFARRFDRQRAFDRVSYRLKQDERRPLAKDAFDAMFELAARQLREHDKHDQADELLRDWRRHYAFVILGVTPEDMGDHAPWNDWIAAWYQRLEAEFGVDYMEWSHLRDIWVLNHSLVVAFAPEQSAPWCQEQLASHPGDTCQREYARHFVGTKYDEPGSDPYNTSVEHHGFAGVVAYWATWAACQYVAAGSGWLICMPAGTLVEMSIERLVAPGVSDMIWKRYN